MNRSEAIAEISKAADISQKDVKTILDAQDKLIVSTIKAGQDFPLGETGKLVPKSRAARKGRNPSTGAEVDIPARNDVKFKSSKALKDSIA